MKICEIRVKKSIWTMRVENLASEIMNTDLEPFLEELKKYITPAKEMTLFALGGRSYYENPASDLLAFFLKPDAEHGLKYLFLSTFFECLGKNPQKFDMGYVDIQREVETKEKKRIDLQIQGQDWCLLIENKVFHWQANPFEDYEAHAKQLRKPAIFSILSPDGTSIKENWTGISYKKYCQALRERMAAIFFDAPISKWQIFAREFILHMENELYNSPMTNEQATFVEDNAAQFIQAQKLLQQYPNYLCSFVKEELEKELRYKVEVVPNWAILIRSPEKWGNAHIAFRTPTDVDQGDHPDNRFDISIYPDEGELKRGHRSSDLLNDKEWKFSAKHLAWLTVKGFKDRHEAIKHLIPRIKLIERVQN